MKKLFFFLFFLALGFSLMSQTPSITVTSPNGGENWVIGSTHNITWNYTNLTGNVRIQLYQMNSTTFTAPIIAETPIVNGSYSWTIPAWITPGNNYKISIMWVSLLTVAIGDVSDNNFTISDNPNIPTLTVISPNGGENWAVGSTHAITWSSSNLAGNVNIALTHTMSMLPDILIATNIPVLNGVFNWTIASTVPAMSDYKIRIYSVASTINVLDTSDNVFTIAGGTTVPSLRVIAPNGGENWTIGSTRLVRWTSMNLGGNVLIQLVKGPQEDVIMTIAQSVPVLQGSFTWAIRDNVLPAVDYKVKITWISMTPVLISDTSDSYFRISIFNAPTLTVVSPNGGEHWASGSTHNIMWNYTNLTGNVTIMLFRSGLTAINATPLILIANNVPISARSYSWTIPMTLPPGENYKVRIASMSPASSATMAIFDQSDNFFTIFSPVVINLSQNPANPGTTIGLETKSPIVVTASVYNIKGQRIRVLFDKKLISGRESVYWDGKDDSHHSVYSGMYFVKVNAGNEEYLKRLIMLK